MYVLIQTIYTNRTRDFMITIKLNFLKIKSAIYSFKKNFFFVCFFFIFQSRIENFFFSFFLLSCFISIKEIDFSFVLTCITLYIIWLHVPRQIISTTKQRYMCTSTLSNK